MPEPGQIRQWQIDDAKPEKHIAAAQESLWVGMNGNGNTPAHCFANAVDAALQALRRGLPIDELDLMPALGRLPADERIILAWRIVASGIEGEAVRRWREMEVVDAAQAVGVLKSSTIVELPATESQARPLTVLEPTA